MAKIVSSYCTKVIGENRIFKDTIRVYRDALSLLIRIVESEWDTGLGELYAKSTLKAQRTVELLVHASRTSVAKYPEFDKQFYKYPSYLAVHDFRGAWRRIFVPCCCFSLGECRQKRERT